VKDSLSRIIETGFSKLGAERHETINIEDSDREDNHEVISLIESSSDSESNEAGLDEPEEYDFEGHDHSESSEAGQDESEEGSSISDDFL
jgi:hypothetical protein